MSTAAPPAPAPLAPCPTCGTPVPADRLRRAPLPTYPVAPPPPGPQDPRALQAPPPARRPRRGLPTPSVPALLLGLGALCLLVAAVAFLAVAWSALGVGGRTAVLVGLTGAAAALGAVLARRGLRIAGESLSVVSLGLLALDVVGAGSAGWLGGASGAALVVTTAAVVALAALAWLPTGLGAPQVVAPLALLVAAVAVVDLTGHPNVVATAGALLLAATAGLGVLTGAGLLPWSAGVAAAVCWTWLASAGLVEAATYPSLRGLWAEGHGLPLLTAAALLAGLAILWRPALAGTTALLTLLAVLPALDEGGTAAGLAVLAALVGWSALGLTTGTGTTLPVRLPLAGAAAGTLGMLVPMLVEATLRVLLLAPPASVDAAVRLPATGTSVHPALAVAGALALVAAYVVGVGRAVPPVAWLAAGALGAVVTLALLPAPLALVVAALAAAGLLAVRTHLTAGVLLVAAVGAALPSEVLVLGALAALVAGCVLVLERAVAAAVLPAALAGLVWTVLTVADVEMAWRGVPVLLALAALALARPRPELEAVAVAAGAVAAALAVTGPTSLAVHLTVAGALLTMHALLVPGRRPVAWAGGLLLAAATWVRLAEIGVTAPEAYTLPSAAALLLVGLARLRRDPAAATGPALTPGLVLATVPSLLWVLALDPVSLRAALLGLGCLALVLGGTTLRWSAPVTVGGLVGALLVIRELAPYAAATPQWVLIGAAGTALTVVGVTWERRLGDLRRAQAYVGRLR
ncbi:hypothetical protein GGQ22_08580 [Nocardioides sp. zg-579]|uniref:Gram-positive cocci surface proteins LPxTG domain-containing protein n=1 Tax=Nocardioides marmotae TaxID=2663857 RepID=A0A6I3J6K6_9ACTN|nr:hypothetical protein [Nocardioides marmotae]MCR6031503.1 hypothetical protein [Gordonia jinghuaiqii]MTB95142.1 hypothetical protein [Nocardioides marmotae]QKE02371.1 hypothetical protein HPC71_15825 [Nocardioides marmotae]